MKAGAAMAMIDRHRLVTRHEVALSRPDPLTPLSVGNGEFVFTADITGLQTYPGAYAKGIPLCTQAQWGWHTMPNPQGYRFEDTLRTFTRLDGQSFAYPYEPREPEVCPPAVRWLAENPHRLNLGRVGLLLPDADGRLAPLEALTGVAQRLRLWDGLLESRFRVHGESVQVVTAVHPTLDALLVRIVSPLVARRRCGVCLSFAYPDPRAVDGLAADSEGQDHETHFLAEEGGGVIRRRIDQDRYEIRVATKAGLPVEQAGPHTVQVWGSRESLELMLYFTPAGASAAPYPSVESLLADVRAHWHDFWETGGAVDLSGSVDPRAEELERRLVLSQYLTAIQCAGSLPPQESGLTHNSWHGKFHLEMHWWHAAHFALWGRARHLERSLGWYLAQLPQARAGAARLGWPGARWPKMVGPDGRETPSWIGPFLIWQQPHPIFFAELLYRAQPCPDVLHRYRDLVEATAQCMAAMPVWDAKIGRYVLGPPLCPAQEACIFVDGYGIEATRNPTFELSYWTFGLAVAQEWRRRLGLPLERDWARVQQELARPTAADGLYLAAESIPESYTNPAFLQDHPAVLGALGMLPGAMMDPEAMRRTLLKVRDVWPWQGWVWGWDYPLAAMCAARLGMPEQALDLLLMETPTNRYLANGHCYQAPELPTYLPANGGLLYAVALMAAGWDGAPDRPAPGFPADGRWQVAWEGLRAAP